MNRKISALGLALFAALAFSALAASAASAATDHITAKESWTPTVSAATTQEFRSTTPIAKGHKCKKVSATVTENIAATTDEITVTPSYEECKAFEGESEPATFFVENGGCDYRFTGVTTKGNPTNAEQEHATFHIENHLEPGQPCHIQTKVTAFKFKCMSVPNQEVEHAVRYEQVGEHILIRFTAHGIDNTTTNSIACPTESGGTETHDNGSYAGDVTVKAHNSNEESIPLTLNENVT